MFSFATGGRLGNLPMPFKIVIGVVAAMFCLSVTYFGMGASPSRNTAMLIVTVGIIFVALLFMVFRFIVKWNSKRKANPMAQGLAGNAAAAPQGVSEPARRARLDDLRRNFEQGVEKFRAAGKNLYSVPWYVLVGEPGSGKTEAIRHCNVGFPPGLQDQLQGAGGTLNMNWWFTNSAIILDTAGRLMFEEVAPGSTNEWNEFLKLLKQSRPNSPINGLLLVIPVDTLIKDSADSIEKKATKIAQQFDQIQRTLGVRFPVFVIITKCDLLNGFREFFDDLNDPQLQHQIMGWSNPAPLDERFDPANVTQHLETVKQRLITRRQNLLLDPVNTEDPQGRRVDQVDALYALPDSLVNIGPRLRRYLEMIFVAGEWSPKPLFLRGIYFTSSMTEGAALDAELAGALGVPVDSLPGGAIFRKDRAYFLRDLFLEKVFREKGLVTRATNADKQQRTRRMMVMGFGFFAVVLLFGITLWASHDLRKSLGGERLVWEEAAGKKFAGDRSISIINLEKDGAYSNAANITVNGSAMSVPDFFYNNLERVQKDLAIPFVFKPITVFAKNPNEERRTAYRQMYEVTVLRPLYTRARTRIPGENWDPQKSPIAVTERLRNAVAELMKLEYASATGNPPAGSDITHPQVELEALFAVALSEEDFAKYSKERGKESGQASDREKLQKVVDWIYTKEAKGNTEWPPAALEPGSQANLNAIHAGVNALIAYWQNQANDDSEALASINKVRTALKDFQAAEATMIKFRDPANPPIDKISLYREFVTQWQTQYDKLCKARDVAAAAWAEASGGSEKATLKDLYTARKESVSSSALKTYEVLLKYTIDTPVEPAKNAASANALIDANKALKTAQANLKDWRASPTAAETLKVLGELDAAYLATVKDTDNAQRHRFEVQAHLYEMADKMLIKDEKTVSITGTASIAEAFAKTDKDASEVTDSARRLAIQASGPTDLLSQAIGLTQFAVDASSRARKFLMADGVLASYPKNVADWNAAISRLSKEVPRESLVRPAVPLVIFPTGMEKTFNDQFSPDAAGLVGDRLTAIGAIASDKDAATKVLDASDLKLRTDAARKSFDGYRGAYIHYWQETVKDEIAYDYSDFKQLSAQLGDTSEANISGKLKQYGDAMFAALNRVGAVDEANSVKLAPQVSPEECRIALQGWANLPPDAAQVRRAILGTVANDFKANYTVQSAKSVDSYVARFWNNLPVAALKALVSEGQKQIREGMTELAKYERFPLAPMTANPQDDLTLADVIAARKALEKIRGAGMSTPAPTAAGLSAPVGTLYIGQGGLTNNRDVDAQLDLLRGTNLLRDKQEYYDKLDKFLAGLPTDNKPFSVQMTPSKDKLRNASDTISIMYSYMPVTQGAKQLLEIDLIGTVNQPVSIDYPDGDITLSFKQTRESKPAQPQMFTGSWALLRLLKSPNVNPNSLIRSADGKTWTLEYYITVPDAPDPKRRALWLTLEFKQAIPDLKDWPVPPGR